MRTRFTEPIRIVETDLFHLVDVERSAALEALIRGDALPFVILDDEVVSTGRLDPEVIAQAIERRSAKR